MNNLSRRVLAFPLEMMIILALCLGGSTAHYLPDNISHFMGESAVDTTGPELDHCDHEDGIPLCIPVKPASVHTSIGRSFLDDRLYLFSPFLSPQFHPPTDPKTI
jgi:hypothetical protein